jgi:signal transduction histidine kinase
MGVVTDSTGNGSRGTDAGHGRPGPHDDRGTRPSQQPADATPGMDGAQSPFHRDGLAVRIAPFAVVAVLGELSLVLPPGPSHLLEAVLSLVLLAATAATVFLPWNRLPAWATVIVPLLYTASVLPLLLASGGTASGISVLLFTALAWTVLFHRPWESASVVAAILAILFVASFYPDEVPADFIIRRLLFWGLLATMIAVAAHGLRARIRRAQEATARLQGRLRELSIMQDRDRIASSLQDNVVQRLFAAGLSLQGIGAQAGPPEVSHRIDAVVHNLDEAIRLLRQSIFGLEHGLPEQGLRRSILDVSNELTPALGLVPEITLDGPIDTAVPSQVAGHLLTALREALSRSGSAVRATRVAVAVVARDSEVSLTVTDNGRRWSARASIDGMRLTTLRERARRLGGTLEVTSGTEGNSKLIWRVPLAAPPARNGRPLEPPAAAGQGQP